jgi:hypothetical protein
MPRVITEAGLDAEGADGIVDVLSAGPDVLSEVTHLVGCIHYLLGRLYSP